MASRWLWVLAAVGLLGAGGVGLYAQAGRVASDPAPGRPPAAVTPSAQPSPSEVPTPSPAVSHPVSLPALIEKDLQGNNLTVGRVLAQTDAYTRYFITYKSGGLTISGIMNVPRGEGPYPLLVLNHGYIDPAVYTNGRGLKREQDYLARRGYVVLHSDYRNHAQSDKDPNSDLNLRLGYVEDAASAVLAVRSASLPYVDADRVGMLGHSMGGGVTMGALVTKPELAAAAVLFAPVSSDYVDNFRRWIQRPQRRQLAERIIAAYGSPEENPDFWRNISPATFFDRVSAPVMVHHGTADSSVPLEWSQETLMALQGAGKQAELFTYPGEPHEFARAWSTVMSRTVAFFDSHLKAP